MIEETSNTDIVDSRTFSETDDAVYVKKDNHVEKDTEESTFEEAISATGYGKFHYIFLLLCGWTLSGDAVDILAISFILPAATCELNLTDGDKGWINSSVFLGIVAGGLVWGSLADIKGRRTILLWCLSVNSLGGLLVTFAQSTWLFILLRFVAGFGSGGSMPVIFTYFCEFQPKNKRGAMTSALAAFWMTGNILAAAVAWAVIPSSLYLKSGSFLYSSWRVHLAICKLNSVTALPTFIFLPESPKFLLSQGQERDAYAVLQKIYACNNKARKGDYPIVNLKLEEDCLFRRRLAHKGSSVTFWANNTTRKITGFCRNVLKLMKKPLRSNTVVMAVVYFTLSFGFFGLFLWLPELFNKVQRTEGSVCSKEMATNMSSFSEDCKVESEVYLHTFLIAASNLPGNIVTFLIIDKVGRKIPLVICMVLSGVLVFFIYIIKSKTEIVVMTCLFSGINVLCWNTSDVLLVEIFPTNLRSTAAGIVMSLGKIAAVLGNIVFGQLVNTNCAVPMIMVATFFVVGGLSAIKLPNMTKVDLL